MFTKALFCIILNKHKTLQKKYYEYESNNIASE